MFVTSIKGRRLLGEELKRVRELGYLAHVDDEMKFEENLNSASEQDDFVAWLMVRSDYVLQLFHTICFDFLFQ